MAGPPSGFGISLFRPFGFTVDALDAAISDLQRVPALAITLGDLIAGFIEHGSHRHPSKPCVRTDANIVEMIALSAQFLFTNFVNNAVQTPIDFPEVEPAKRPCN